MIDWLIAAGTVCPRWRRRTTMWRRSPGSSRRRRRISSSPPKSARSSSRGTKVIRADSLCFLFLVISAPDPNPDPPDPHVFGPPGSGSVSIDQWYGSGSGSFYHHAKLGGKTLIPIVLWLLLDFLILKNDVNVPAKSTVISRKTYFKKFVFCWRLECQWRKKQDPDPIRRSGSGSLPKCHGSGTLLVIIYIME